MQCVGLNWGKLNFFTYFIRFCNILPFQNTLHILQATGVTAFAHFDEYLRLQRLEAFVEKFKTAIFHRTYYSYEDYENYEDWEWDEVEEDEDDAAESEIDQGMD